MELFSRLRSFQIRYAAKFIESQATAPGVERLNTVVLREVRMLADVSLPGCPRHGRDNNHRRVGSPSHDPTPSPGHRQHHPWSLSPRRHWSNRRDCTSPVVCWLRSNSSSPSRPHPLLNRVRHQRIDADRLNTRLERAVLEGVFRWGANVLSPPTLTRRCGAAISRIRPQRLRRLRNRSGGRFGDRRGAHLHWRAARRR